MATKVERDIYSFFFFFKFILMDIFVWNDDCAHAQTRHYSMKYSLASNDGKKSISIPLVSSGDH